MPRYNAPFEIHVHGDVALRADVGFRPDPGSAQATVEVRGRQVARRRLPPAPTRKSPASASSPRTTCSRCAGPWPATRTSARRSTRCAWRSNELSERGAAIEVTFYDTDFDEEEGDPDEESRDDFVMLFVGPNPAAIMQVQRDLLVEDVVNLMERHFDGAELGGVVAEIDRPVQRPLRCAGEFARDRQAPARHGRHRWWRQRRPWRRSPPAPPALSAHACATLSAATIAAAWRRSFLRPPCNPGVRKREVFGAGPCTTSPILGLHDRGHHRCVRCLLRGRASPKARPGAVRLDRRRSASPMRS